MAKQKYQFSFYGQTTPQPGEKREDPWEVTTSAYGATREEAYRAALADLSPRLRSSLQGSDFDGIKTEVKVPTTTGGSSTRYVLQGERVPNIVTPEFEGTPSQLRQRQGLPNVGGLDIIRDSVTGRQYSRASSTDTYKPYSVTDASSAVGSFKMPTDTPSTPDLSEVSGRTSYWSEQIAAAEKEREDALAQMEKAEKQQKSQTKTWLQKLMGSDSPSEVRDDAFQETGINARQYFADEKARVAEIETLTKEYNSLVAARDQQLAQSYDKLASTNFIDNQQAQIQRNAAPRLNELAANIQAKAATLEALQGRFQEAQQYADRAAEYATADLRFNMQMFQTFYDINQDTINRLDKKYQDSLAYSRDLAEKQYMLAYDEKKRMSDLMLDAARDGIDLSSYMGGSYEAMISAFSRMGGTSGTSPSTLTQQVLDGFRTLDSLSANERTRVMDDLYRLGLNQSTPPDWFREYIQDQYQQSLTQRAFQEEWDSYSSRIKSQNKAQGGLEAIMREFAD